MRFEIYRGTHKSGHFEIGHAVKPQSGILPIVPNFFGVLCDLDHTAPAVQDYTSSARDWS
jgi:hypothetical protein